MGGMPRILPGSNEPYGSPLNCIQAKDKYFFQHLACGRYWGDSTERDTLFPTAHLQERKADCTIIAEVASYGLHCVRCRKRRGSYEILDGGPQFTQQMGKPSWRILYWFWDLKVKKGEGRFQAEEIACAVMLSTLVELEEDQSVSQVWATDECAEKAEARPWEAMQKSLLSS